MENKSHKALASAIKGDSAVNDIRSLSINKLKRLFIVLIGSGTTVGLSGCLVVGRSSSGRWFVWPGGLGFLLVILIIFFLMRRR
jgi:ABC-type Fe3+-siderophore transport system permease subunit